MSDTYTETTRTDWTTRIAASIKGIGAGIILAGLAGYGLFWNEGSAVQTVKSLTEGAGLVVNIDAARVDPANEGKLVAVVPPYEAEAALAAMHHHPLGKGASIIGHIGAGEAGRVTMRTCFGGKRIVDMLVGDQLPRIC